MTAGLFKSGYEHWRFTSTTDPAGQPIEEWNKIADIEGRAYPTTATAGFAAAVPFSEIDWIFATGPDTDLQIGDEVRFNGRRLEVKVIPETSTGRRFEARCKELFA